MAGFVNLAGVEKIVRVLLALPSRPALVFLSVRGWCRSKSCRHTPGANLSQWLYTPNMRSPYADVERSFLDLCTHYDLSCLSQYKALSPLVFAGRVNVTDFVPDGLHPSSSFGQHVLAAILRRWLRDASKRHTGTSHGNWTLPRALHPRNARQAPETSRPRCYHFGKQMGAPGPMRIFSVLRPLSWHTA
eukprot:5722157-Prymnesium_polylepis.2